MSWNAPSASLHNYTSKGVTPQTVTKEWNTPSENGLHDLWLTPQRKELLNNWINTLKKNRSVYPFITECIKY